MSRLTILTKVIIFACLVGSAVFSVRIFAPSFWGKVFRERQVAESMVPKAAPLPDLPDSAGVTRPARVAGGSFPQLSSYDLVPGCAELPEVRVDHWAWNAHMGAILATGGRQSAKGSLMCKHRVNLKLQRQDWANKMQEDLIACAQELAAGQRDCSKGVHFVTIMGDGAAAFLAGLNPTLERLGPEYRAKVVGSCGYSVGEDKFMGPPACKTDPQACRGLLVAGVLKDGDWNIAQKFAGDNGICNNPDDRTYDPNCLNWVNTPGYIEAAEAYIAGQCEDRSVVQAGKKTGESRRVCVGGVVTWTPGDVNVATKKGGLVSIASTREYRWQMPNTVIGIDKWMKNHRSVVEGMLAAIFEGGDAVKTSDQALRHAAVLSNLVYQEKGTDPEYWYKYYHGTTETDVQGLRVELGGSSVNNLADNLQLFGLAPGSANLFAATYTVFGDIVVQQYPNDVPSYPPVAQILDTSYVAAVAQRMTSVARADMPTFEASAPVSQVVGRRSWTINFRSGSAEFTPDTLATIEQLHRDLLVAGGAAIEVHGHTDGLGDDEVNNELSRQRALAVREWLKGKSPAHFSDSRVRSFGHGETQPVADNATVAGRAHNRRVEIVLGTL